MSEDREDALRRFDDARAVTGDEPATGSAAATRDAPSTQAQDRPSSTQARQPSTRAPQSSPETHSGPSRIATATSAPLLLPANPVFRFYRGGAGIDRFRGVEPGSGPGAPEDWVGSTTTSFGNDIEGLAALGDGRILRDVIAADPEAYLGTQHVAAFGANPGLLVKLLDAGERLSVHFHPDRGFAREHLHSDFGKTEAWLILEAEPGAHMHLGLQQSVDLETLHRWVTEQDSEEMLSALHKVPVSAGDALFVPAGTLHTIGSGITLIELQEPSDMSVVVEWRNAGVTNGDEHLQLGWDQVLPAAEINATAPIHIPARHAELDKSSLKRLLPPEADPYFRAERLTLQAGQPLRLQPLFSILIGTSGDVTLSNEMGESLRLKRGTAVVIPFGAGMTTLSGAGTAIRCLPPVVGAGEGR